MRFRVKSNLAAALSLFGLLAIAASASAGSNPYCPDVVGPTPPPSHCYWPPGTKSVQGEFRSLASSSGAPMCIGPATSGKIATMVPCPTSTTSATITYGGYFLYSNHYLPTIESNGQCLTPVSLSSTLTVLEWQPCGPSGAGPLFGYVRGQLVGGANGTQCVSTLNGSTFAGDWLILTGCNPAAANQVFFPAQFPIAIESALTDSNGNLMLQDNHDGSSGGLSLIDVEQATTRFRVPLAAQYAEIASNYPAYCLNIWGGVADIEPPWVFGQSVGTYWCAGTANEEFEWSLNGTYNSNGVTVPGFSVSAVVPTNYAPVSSTQLCLDINSSNVLDSYTCSGSANQRFGVIIANY